MNYTVINDFPFVRPDKKIDLLKKGSILAPDPGSSKYVFKQGPKQFLFESELIEKNPDFFEAIDWREDLLTEMKKCKVKTVSPMFKVVTGFLDNNVFNVNTLVPNEYLNTLASLCFDKYMQTKDIRYLEPLSSLGYVFNEDRIQEKTKKGD